MHETDKDIAELERLLGPAVSDYRSLESRRELENRPPIRRRSIPARFSSRIRSSTPST